eukprot:scaffold69158_cov22-Tisochrysis_lutea.AAC.1
MASNATLASNPRICSLLVMVTSFSPISMLLSQRAKDLFGPTHVRHANDLFGPTQTRHYMPPIPTRTPARLHQLKNSPTAVASNIAPYFPSIFLVFLVHCSYGEQSSGLNPHTRSITLNHAHLPH